ncbi:MAG: TonB-dependent receptor [Bacteroidales bacterium]|nr:TonB-dependent receptor [Bacteroidales bacterium]
MDKEGVSWGNKLVSMRWNRVMNERLFSNLTLCGSHYGHNFNGYAGENVPFQLNTGIKYYSLKYDFSYFSNANNKINFGLNSYYQEMMPLQNSFKEHEVFSFLNRNSYKRMVYTIYSEGNYSLSRLFNVQGGLRLSMLHNIEPQIKTRIYAEPLLSLGYLMTEKFSWKASYSRNVQFYHGINVLDLFIPYDHYLFSNNTLKPQVADHFSTGGFCG